MKWVVVAAGAAVGLLSASESRAVSVTTAGTPVSESFDSMAASGTAALPTDWKMSAAGGGTSALYSSATNVTAVTQQASTGSPTAGGRYNWGTSASERAAGFMTSGSYASPNAILVQYTNNTGSTITDLVYTFDYERYRNNTATASIAFSTSVDDAVYTAQSAGDQSYAAGTNVYGYTIDSASKSVSVSGLSIAPGSNFYAKWVFTNTGSSNSQGLGLDNVSVTASVPEPGVFGLAGGLGLLALRRRPRKA